MMLVRYLPRAIGLFATGVATSVLLITAHDRPFTGEISVGPGPLLQVMPDASLRGTTRGINEEEAQ
jgi:hypothetical protein